jgi:hypothetical protein
LHLITSDCDEATKLARVQVKAAPGGILADFADLPALAPTGAVAGTDAVVPPEYAALADSAVLSIVLVGVVDPFEAERAERANAKVQQLVEMGFPKERAARVLSEVDGNMEAATTALLAAPAQVDEGVPNTAANMEADGTFPFRDGTGASGESGAVLGGDGLRVAVIGSGGGGGGGSGGGGGGGIGIGGGGGSGGGGGGHGRRQVESEEVAQWARARDVIVLEAPAQTAAHVHRIVSSVAQMCLARAAERRHREQQREKALMEIEIALNPKGWFSQPELDELYRAVEAAKAAGVDARRLQPAQSKLEELIRRKEASGGGLFCASPRKPQHYRT